MIRKKIRNWRLGKNDYNQQLCNCKPMEIAHSQLSITNIVLRMIYAEIGSME